jgi:DNA modification methylase
MEIKQLELKDLIPYANNPRKKQAIDKVASSIKEFGWQQPIVVDEANVIIVGHTRYQAAQKLGLKKAPVQVAKGLTDAQVKAYRILDNRANQDALWDDELLKIEVQDLDKMDIDLALTGFDDKELDKLLYEEKEGLTDEDAVPEEVEPRVKQGELWQLGNHRLLCGDSTNEGDVAKVMDNQKADMVFTDPPYNVSIGTIKHHKFKQREILNDSMSQSAFREFCDAFASNIKKFTDGIIYCWSGQGADGRIMFTILDEYFHNSTTIMWYKDQFTLGRGKYQNQYEPCWFGWNKNGNSFVDDRKLVNVWKVKRPKKSDLHPTMKPIELVEMAVTHSSKQKDIILDIFAGSGSTLIGCEKTKRLFYGIELDPKYCDVIIKRWEDYTGQTAQLLERGTDTNSFKEDEQWQDQKNIKSTEKKSLN